MTRSDNSISALIVRYVNGEATPEEKRELKKWASLSDENRIWLERFKDKEWLQAQADIYHAVDLDACRKKFWSRVAAHEQQQKEQLNKQAIRRIRNWSVAAAITIACGSGYYFYRFPERTIVATRQTTPTADGSKVITHANNAPLTRGPQSRERIITPPAVVTTRGIRKPDDNKDITHTSPVTVTAYDTSMSADNNGIIPLNSTPLAPGSRQASFASAGGMANFPHHLTIPVPRTGYRQRHVLPDGSLVWLNSATTFRYPFVFNGAKRRVEINGGEAYFEIRKIDTIPFLAVVNGTHIEIAGGRFNVKAYAEEAKTIVTALEGNVWVAAHGDGMLLNQNESALIENKKCIAVCANNDTARIIAWKNKMFLFQNDGLAVVLRELARWYDLELPGDIDPQVLVSYTGSRLDTADEVIEKMNHRNPNIHLTIEGKKLIIDCAERRLPECTIFH